MTPRPGPRDLRSVATRARHRSGRVARVVGPEHERALGVRVADPAEVELPGVVERHRHRPQARELGAHRVGRVRDRGVEHGVARRVPQMEQVRQRRRRAPWCRRTRSRRPGRAAGRSVGGSTRPPPSAAPGCRSTAGTRWRSARRRRARGARPRGSGRPGCRSSSRRPHPAPRRPAGAARRADRAGTAAGRNRRRGHGGRDYPGTGATKST